MCGKLSWGCEVSAQDKNTGGGCTGREELGNIRYTLPECEPHCPINAPQGTQGVVQAKPLSGGEATAVGVDRWYCK
jgi:hypothetical protein